VGVQFETLRSAYLSAVQSAASTQSSASTTSAIFSSLAAQQSAIGTQVKTMLQSNLSSAGMASLDALI
jgi:hypothetical protein